MIPRKGSSNSNGNANGGLLEHVYYFALNHESINNGQGIRILLPKAKCNKFSDVVWQLTEKLSQKGIIDGSDNNGNSFWISCGIDSIDDEDSWMLFSETNQLFNILLHRRIIDKYQMSSSTSLQSSKTFTPTFTSVGSGFQLPAQPSLSSTNNISQNSVNSLIPNKPSNAFLPELPSENEASDNEINKNNKNKSENDKDYAYQYGLTPDGFDEKMGNDNNSQSKPPIYEKQETVASDNDDDMNDDLYGQGDADLQGTENTPSGEKNGKQKKEKNLGNIVAPQQSLEPKTGDEFDDTSSNHHKRTKSTKTRKTSKTSKTTKRRKSKKHSIFTKRKSSDIGHSDDSSDDLGADFFGDHDNGNEGTTNVSGELDIDKPMASMASDRALPENDTVESQNGTPLALAQMSQLVNQSSKHKSQNSFDASIFKNKKHKKQTSSGGNGKPPQAVGRQVSQSTGDIFDSQNGESTMTIHKLLESSHHRKTMKSNDVFENVNDFVMEEFLRTIVTQMNLVNVINFETSFSGNFSVFDQFVHECTQIGIRSFKSRLRILKILFHQIEKEFNKHSNQQKSDEKNDNNNNNDDNMGKNLNVYTMVLDNFRQNILEPSKNENSVQQRLSVAYMANEGKYSISRRNSNAEDNKENELGNDAVLAEYISELVLTGMCVTEYKCDGCHTLQPAMIGNDNLPTNNVNIQKYGIILDQCGHTICRQCYFENIKLCMQYKQYPECTVQNCEKELTKNDICKEFGSTIANYIVNNLQRELIPAFGNGIGSMGSMGSMGGSVRKFGKMLGSHDLEDDASFDMESDDKLELPSDLPDGWIAKIVNISRDSNELMFVDDGIQDNKSKSDNNVKKQKIVYIDNNGVIDDKNKKEKITSTYPKRGEKMEAIIDLVYKECDKRQKDGIPFTELPIIYQNEYKDKWNIRAWFNLKSNNDFVRLIDKHFKDTLSYDLIEQVVMPITEHDIFAKQIETLVDKSNENAKIEDLNKNPLFLNFKKKLEEKRRMVEIIEIVEKTDHSKWKQKEIKNTLDKDYMLLWQQGVDMATIEELNINLGFNENKNEFIGIGEIAKYIKFWLDLENKTDTVLFEILKKHSQSIKTALKQENSGVANAIVFQMYNDIGEYLNLQKNITKQLLSCKDEMKNDITRYFQVAALEFNFILDLMNLKLDAKSMKNARYEGYFTKFNQMKRLNIDSNNINKEERHYVEITKLERIQNCKLLSKYLEYYQSCLNNDPNGMKERYLFHGSGYLVRPNKIWRSKTGFDCTKSKIGKKLWLTSDASYAMSGFQFGKTKQHKLDKVKVMQYQIMLCLCCCSSKQCDSYDDGLIYGFKDGAAIYPAYTISYVVHSVN